jgi:hypothetical protein
MRALWWAPLAFALGVSCGPAGKQPVRATPPQPDAATEKTGMIHFDCEPADVQVRVDGEDKGAAVEISRQGGLALPYGLHRIEITKEGHRPFRLELILGPKAETIKVELQPVGTPGS